MGPFQRVVIWYFATGIMLMGFVLGTMASDCPNDLSAREQVAATLIWPEFLIGLITFHDDHRRVCMDGTSWRSVR
jgi:hypothetical protein